MMARFKILKVLIASIIIVLFLGCITLFVISYCVDGTFDYCDSNSDAKKIFEERVVHINTLLEAENMVKLNEEDTSNTNDYYYQEYEMVEGNEKIEICMICDNNKLKYSFSCKKYGNSTNFEYTEQEIATVTKILNSISKKKFGVEEIYEFINAEESKYSVERYGFKKNGIIDKIKYLNDFTRDAAFEHSIWSKENGYISLFSINGKFIKELDNK